MSAALPDPLWIPPFTRPVRGSITLPGSKSITNRALLLAALCDQPNVTLMGALFSEDTHLMAGALAKLGFNVRPHPERAELSIDGCAGRIPAESADLFVGLAGTAARFLTAFCAAAPRGVFRLDGVPQMRRRPMRPLIEALRGLGADIRCTGEEGFLPLEIHARGLAGGSIELDASESSQLLSALLMVAPSAKTDVHIALRGSVRQAYVDMTARMMRAFTPDSWPIVDTDDTGGILVRAQPWPYFLPGDGRYAIEADASAASYFLALPLVAGGSLALGGAQDAGRGLQGDTEFADVVRGVGATVSSTPHGLDVSFGRAQPRRSVVRDFKAISDTFLTLAALAPLLDGPTRISGIAHTRRQETDRVAGAARELTRLGQHVVETEDALEIHPRPLTAGVEIETYDDHRFAMSFGILGCHNLHGDGRPWLAVRHPACCAKTFPHFFDLLASLREKSSEP